MENNIKDENTSNDEFTTIRIRKSTLKKLWEIGTRNMNNDEALNLLIKEYRDLKERLMWLIEINQVKDKKE